MNYFQCIVALESFITLPISISKTILIEKARQLPGFYSINYGAITRRIHQLRRNNQKQPILERLKVLG